VGNAEINLSEERLLLGADYDDHDLVFARPDGTPTQPCSMSISLDAFVAGPNESMDNGVGDGGERLHEWTVTDNFGTDLEGGVRSGGVNGQVIDEFMSTGAVVAGRGTFELHVVPVLSVKGVVCSRTSATSRSASSAPGSSKARTVSRTCTTECCTDEPVSDHRSVVLDGDGHIAGRRRRSAPAPVLRRSLVAAEPMGRRRGSVRSWRCCGREDRSDRRRAHASACAPPSADP
jgi:hypothetical protein